MTSTTWHPREGRGVIPLRPLSVSEILDAPFASMRRYPAAMIGVGCAVAAIVSAGTLAWALWLRPWLLYNSGRNVTVTVTVALLLLVAVIVFVAAGWQTAITTDALLGRETSAAQAWRLLRPRIWQLVSSALVAVVPLAIFLALVALTAWIGAAGGILVALYTLPAIWLGVIAFFLTPVVIVEQVTVRTAVRRAFALVRGSWWRCFGVLLLSTCVAAMVGAGVLLPFEAGTAGFLSGGVISGDGVVLTAVLPSIGAVVSYAIVMPLLASVITVLYVDLRIRTEAFDLTLTGAVPGLAAARP